MSQSIGTSVREQTGRFVSIQLVRAAAAWMVVFQHHENMLLGTGTATSWRAFFAAHGRYGVDLFFVVSGVVMYTVVARKPIRPADFLIRRLDRILLPYWIATFLTILVMPVPGFTELGTYTWTSLLLSLLLIPHQNPNSEWAMPLLTVGWTLFAEIVFYMTVAATMPLRKWRVEIWLIANCVVLILVPRLPMSEAAANTLRDARIYEFPMGLCVGYLFHEYIAQFRFRPRMIMGITVFLSAIFGLMWGELLLHGTRIGFYLGYGSYYAAAAFVLAALCFEDVFRSSTVCQKAAFLGDISYSTYLLHFLVIAALIHAFGRPIGLGPESAFFVAAIANILVLSVIFWRFVERANPMKALLFPSRSQATPGAP